MAVIPFAEGFMEDISANPYDANLMKSVCNDCGTGFFGTKDRCENCASQDVEQGVLDRDGEIYTYTIQRYPPPEPYKLGSTDRDEWTPRPVAYGEFDGVRFLGLVDGDRQQLEVGAPIELVVEPGWETDDGDEVLIYKFALQENET
ncbi:Zn-ribbon domain-containing OB-fold protein [Halosolutus amylolyticus]|uniref:Zn-ribbon domain-containing OB-fold protein n=1 Tax=Halosolutus amylolyticus TaxID=2932267 RepID=A0ABD5PIE9_9EURY|nr:OB-fold domain-containing protein [Halosolutus amylolyticus]